jgi:hypothetical protein
VVGCLDDESQDLDDTPTTQRASPSATPVGARAALPTNAVYAWGLDDPTYPLTEYEDLAAAVNAALRDMNAELSAGAPIYLPPIDGTHTITSGAIDVPPFGKSKQPAIVGPNAQSANETLKVAIGESFPDDSFLRLDAEGPSGNGFTFSGVAIRDANGVLSTAVIDIKNAARSVLTHLDIWANGGARRVIDLHEDQGDTIDFANLHDVNLKITSSGQTCLRCSAGQVWMTHADVGSTGDNLTFTDDTTGIEMVGASGAFITAYLHKLERGIHLVDTNETVDPGGGRGNYFLFRCERPGQEVRHPFYNEGWHGTTVVPINSPQGQYRHSLDTGTDTRWVTDAAPTHPGAAIGGGGAGLPSTYETTGDVRPVPGAVELRAEPGSEAVLDNDGVPLLTPVRDTERVASGLSERKPTLSLKVDPSDESGAITRFGLVEEPWSDWVGGVYDADEGAYHLRAVRDGSVVEDVDASLPATGRGDLFTIAHGPATVRKPGETDDITRVRETEGTLVSVGMLALGGNPEATTSLVAEIDSQFDGCEVAVGLENDGDGTRTSRLYEGRMVYARSNP